MATATHIPSKLLGGLAKEVLKNQTPRLTFGWTTIEIFWEHHLAGQIECSMVGLREFLITTTIIEEIPVDPMELLNECQMAYLILIQVGSLLTTMALCRERVG
jgi:hypothetical protein